MKMLIDNPNDVNIPSALSILSLQSVSNHNQLKGEFEPLGFKSKPCPFPSAWLTVLLFLLLCHHVSASELLMPSAGSSEQSGTPTVDYRLDRDLMHQLLNELNVARLEDVVLKTTSASQVPLSGWQLNLDRVELGGVESDSQDMWTTQDYRYRDLLSQDSRLYSGWGARAGYRFQLASGLSALFRVGAFNWEQDPDLIFDPEQKLIQTVTSDGIAPYLGVGFNFMVSPKSDIRFEWDHFELDDRSFEVIGLKFEYRF